MSKNNVVTYFCPACGLEKYCKDSPEDKRYDKGYRDLCNRCDRFQRGSTKGLAQHWEKSQRHAWARAQAKLALAAGDVLRPPWCACCGKECYWPMAHHEDIDYPLEIDWLCKDCYQELHRIWRRKGLTFGDVAILLELSKVRRAQWEKDEEEARVEQRERVEEFRHGRASEARGA